MKDLIQGLREFRDSYFCSNFELFEQLAHGQTPKVLFITCSDSRVDPNLITQAQPGDLFVVRNAGNIIPPYGAANGGEGAAIEYAINALGIEQVIVCGHSHCGAMKGLLKLESLEASMPLVHNWLKHAEATRRLVKDHYSSYEGEELIEVAIAENVLTQLENLKTYPIVHSRIYQGKLRLYGWIYNIEMGEVLEYNVDQHAFVPIQHTATPAEMSIKLPPIQINKSPVTCPIPEPDAFPLTWLSPEQEERIYRGSAASNGSRR
ncbi:carbonic anhydrase [Oscillatoria sp. FACHB-1407]|uniref:carbonic anhydrase n=1 Tax=Oscillatoria sp. FACHB-1407 TaxID=2692847 RepID=UPI00168212F1|nr:carbonic anhydrase [Oscillatoria sp. FACHB-1407]MBD2462316.1 carbonic anhydrase [Oscillatoria sp. FACHB-1407]